MWRRVALACPRDLFVALRMSYRPLLRRRSRWRAASRLYSGQASLPQAASRFASIAAPDMFSFPSGTRSPAFSIAVTLFHYYPSSRLCLLADRDLYCALPRPARDALSQ